MISTKLIIGKAADLIEQHGWTQNTSARNTDGEPVDTWAINAACFCMSGAVDLILFQMFVPPTDRRLYDEVIDRAFCEALPPIEACEPKRGYIGWQDMPGRTKEEVVAVMRQAAA